MTDQFLSEMRGQVQRDSTTFQEALEASLGYNQTWQDVSGSRALNQPYTNDTGKPIQVIVSGYMPHFSNLQFQLKVDEVIVCISSGSVDGDGSVTGNVSAVVPNGSTYSITLPNGGSLIIDSWVELRS